MQNMINLFCNIVDNVLQDQIFGLSGNILLMSTYLQLVKRMGFPHIWCCNKHIQNIRERLFQAEIQLQIK